MQQARLPLDEDGRLRALRRYQVLDTLPEQDFDDITLVASQICDTPIALVSLVDEDRQWFKSRRGLDATQTTRDVAFCAHAILEPDELFMVGDTTHDLRFADNPLVVDAPGIQFYAGAPLVSSDGHALGTLCVLDRQPRTLSADQGAALRALAQQVMSQLELRLANRSLVEAAVELEATRSALARSNEDLEHYAYVAAHDLKEPLRMIGSFADLLQESAVSRLTEEELLFLDQVRDGASRGAAMTADVLDYARLETERDSVPVDLFEIFESAAADVPTKGGATSVELRSTLPVLLGNRSQLGRLLQNLIVNGLKYNDSSRPRVVVVGRQGSEAYHLEVADNGIGIPVHAVDQVFGMFKRVHERGRFPGTGIGLAVCRRVMELHDGTISVQSTVGQGSVFTCSFPNALILKEKSHDANLDLAG